MDEVVTMPQGQQWAGSACSNATPVGPRRQRRYSIAIGESLMPPILEEPLDAPPPAWPGGSNSKPRRRSAAQLKVHQQQTQWASGAGDDASSQRRQHHRPAPGSAPLPSLHPQPAGGFAQQPDWRGRGAGGSSSVPDQRTPWAAAQLAAPGRDQQQRHHSHDHQHSAAPAVAALQAIQRELQHLQDMHQRLAALEAVAVGSGNAAAAVACRSVRVSHERVVQQALAAEEGLTEHLMSAGSACAAPAAAQDALAAAACSGAPCQHAAAALRHGGFLGLRDHERGASSGRRESWDAEAEAEAHHADATALLLQHYGHYSVI
jgi:hypothetical protein